MSRATLTRVRRLEVKACLDDSIRNISDETLDAWIAAVVEGLGGFDKAIEAILDMKRTDLRGALLLWAKESRVA
jgi:hypothetical protein